MPLRNNYSSTAQATVLSAGMDASTTSADTPLGVAGWPAAPFQAVIERGTSAEEVVLITSGSTVGSIWRNVVTRGYAGTAAKAHPAGAKFEHITSSDDFSQFRNEINKLRMQRMMTPGLEGYKFRATVGGVVPTTATAMIAAPPAGTRTVTKSMTVSNFGSVGTIVRAYCNGTGAMWLCVPVDGQETKEIPLAFVQYAGEPMQFVSGNSGTVVTAHSCYEVEDAEFSGVGLPQRYCLAHVTNASGQVIYTASGAQVITQIIVANIGAAAGQFVVRINGHGAIEKPTLNPGESYISNVPHMIYSGNAVNVDVTAGTTMAFTLLGHALHD